MVIWEDQVQACIKSNNLTLPTKVIGERVAFCPRSDVVGLPTRVVELHLLQTAASYTQK